MLGTGVCSLIVSLTFVGSGILDSWVIILIALSAITIIVLFFFYNQKWS